MKNLLHRLAHWLNRNAGCVVTWHEDGRYMAGFRCDGCGVVQGVHEVPRHISHPEEFIRAR